MIRCLLLTVLPLIQGGLVLDNLFNHSNAMTDWLTDYSGNSGKIGFLRDENGKIEGISTNVTYCSSSPCYRAELKTPDSLRSSILSSTSGEYWIGISIRIPSNWQWITPTTQQITCYIFQIHGGDNMGQSPIIGIRNEGWRYRLNVCGNTASSSSDSTCQYFNLGDVKPGEWEDWVIYDKFSFDDTSSVTRGVVRVWRNGIKLVDTENLLTSYNDVKPHYLKFGSYIIQWKTPPVANTLVDWVGSDYRALRVGDSTSSYEEVYTGITPIGQPSLAPTPQPTTAKPSKPSSSGSGGGGSSSSFSSLYLWVAIGGGGGTLSIILLTKLYMNHRANQTKELKQIQTPPSSAPPHSSSTALSQKIEMSSIAPPASGSAQNNYAAVVVEEMEEQI
jgi:hypothetical protein